MAERSRELGGQFEAIIDSRITFCAMMQFMLTHHMVNKIISSTRRSCWIQISTPSTVVW